MHFDFRPLLRRTFAELSRKYCENILIRRPRPSAGGASEEQQAPGAFVLGSRKASLLKVGCCIWSLVLGTCKYVLQDHGIWLWRSFTYGSLAATYEGKGKYAVPFSCRTPGQQEVVALLLASCDVYHDDDPEYPTSSKV